MPRVLRFYSKESVEGNSPLRLSAAESHHLLHVLRAGPGAKVIVFDPSGSAWNCDLISEIEGIAELSVADRIESSSSGAPPLHIAVSAIKRRGMDWMIEKLSELGADELQMLDCDRTVVDFKPGEESPVRWDRIALAAAKQCGRNLPMRSLAPVKLLPWLNENSAGQACKAFAHFTPGAATLGEWLRSADPSLPLLIAIGPEGGWTDREADAFVAAGFAPVRLGELTLRAETAAIAAAAACRLLQPLPVRPMESPRP